MGSVIRFTVEYVGALSSRPLISNPCISEKITIRAYVITNNNSTSRIWILGTPSKFTLSDMGWSSSKSLSQITVYLKPFYLSKEYLGHKYIVLLNANRMPTKVINDICPIWRHNWNIILNQSNSRLVNYRFLTGFFTLMQTLIKAINILLNEVRIITSEILS